MWHSITNASSAASKGWVFSDSQKSHQEGNRCSKKAQVT